MSILLPTTDSGNIAFTKVRTRNLLPRNSEGKLIYKMSSKKQDGTPPMDIIYGKSYTEPLLNICLTICDMLKTKILYYSTADVSNIIYDYIVSCYNTRCSKPILTIDKINKELQEYTINPKTLELIYNYEFNKLLTKILIIYQTVLTSYHVIDDDIIRKKEVNGFIRTIEYLFDILPLNDTNQLFIDKQSIFVIKNNNKFKIHCNSLYKYPFTYKKFKMSKPEIVKASKITDSFIEEYTETDLILALKWYEDNVQDVDFDMFNDFTSLRENFNIITKVLPQIIKLPKRLTLDKPVMTMVGKQKKTNFGLIKNTLDDILKLPKVKQLKLRVLPLIQSKKEKEPIVKTSQPKSNMVVVDMFDNIFDNKLLSKINRDKLWKFVRYFDINAFDKKYVNTTKSQMIKFLNDVPVQALDSLTKTQLWVISVILSEKSNNKLKLQFNKASKQQLISYILSLNQPSIGGFDFQKTLTSIFPDTELHLPKHNFCGPGTKLDKRLVNFDKDTGENDGFITKPINKLDKGCYEHDIQYTKHKDLPNRWKADKELINVANSVIKDKSSSNTQKFYARITKTLLQGKMLFGGCDCSDPKLTDKVRNEYLKILTTLINE